MAEQDTDTVDEGKPEVSESEKNLQRQLHRAREREKELIRQQLETGTTAATVNRLEDVVLKILERDSDESEVSSFQSRKESDTNMLMHRTKVAEILSEKNLAWGDEELATARTKWDAGDYAGAVLDAVQAGGDETSADDIEAEIEKRVTERLREGARAVDTGNSTQSGQKRYTVGDIGDMSPAELTENIGEVADQFFKR